MKVLKRILLVVAIIIAIPLLIALFVTSEYTIEREMTVGKSRQEVYEYIKMIRNQEYYNKWVMADPDMKKEYLGTDGTVGFVYRWNGNDQVGAGEQEIKTLVEGQRVNTELRFLRPMEGIGNVSFVIDSLAPAETNVTWIMSGKSTYPFNLMNLFIESTLGDAMGESLLLLKEKVEKQ